MKRWTHKEVKKYIESFEGYKLLSTEYKNYDTKLKIQCPKGHIYKANFDHFKRGQYKYHLDHIYTVIDGFKNNIPPEVIANPYNLQMLWWEDNISKNNNSEITKQELYLGYYKFILERGYE